MKPTPGFMIWPITAVLILLTAACPASAQVKTRDIKNEPGRASKRIALVVGNKNYESPTITTLDNSLNDADSMAQVLRVCGFELLPVCRDADLRTMEGSLEELGRRLATGGWETVLFYYSGHGMQVDGENYLVPTDARLSIKTDVGYQTMQIQRILDMMEYYHVPVKILLLDACRDMPPAWRSLWKGGPPSAGLAGMNKAPLGTFIGFAASPGERSSDGGSLGNGVYTRAILSHIRTPNISIDELFTRVAATTHNLISKSSPGEKQVPFKNSSLMGNFYFLRTDFGDPDPEPDPDPVPPPPPDNKLTDALAGTFVLVKGGTFTMGCQDGRDVNCDDDEKPAHVVRLNDFYLGETEVTQAQFRNFINETGYRTYAEKDGGSYIWNGSYWENKAGIDWRCDASGQPRATFEGDHPVTHVSWNDANAFIDWLNSRSGGGRYRLPTEAEWEYAARGGRLSRGYQYAGSNDVAEVAWYAGNSGGSTPPVKGKAANELGLYDMTGNVWEWCSDWYGAYSSGSQENPAGPSSGSGRVFRGGSWVHAPQSCRVSRRGNSTPDRRSGNLGFRLARAVNF